MARSGGGEHQGQEVCQHLGQTPEERRNQTGLPAEGQGTCGEEEDGKRMEWGGEGREREKLERKRLCEL